MKLEEASRQRIDYTQGPNGETIATMTVSLADGSVHRYSASVDEEELDEMGSRIASAEATQMKVSGMYTDDQIAGFWGSIKKSFKKVRNVAKKVANSKVMRLAEKGMALAGKVYPPAAGIAAGMATARKLANSELSFEAGARLVGGKMAAGAVRSAQKYAVGNSKYAKALLAWGNKRRKGMSSLANRQPVARRRATYRRRSTARRGAPRAPSKSQAMVRARQGRMVLRWVAI